MPLLQFLPTDSGLELLPWLPLVDCDLGYVSQINNFLPKMLLAMFFITAIKTKPRCSSCLPVIAPSGSSPMPGSLTTPFRLSMLSTQWSQEGPALKWTENLSQPKYLQRKKKTTQVSTVLAVPLRKGGFNTLQQTAFQHRIYWCLTVVRNLSKAQPKSHCPSPGCSDRELLVCPCPTLPYPGKQCLHPSPSLGQNLHVILAASLFLTPTDNQPPNFVDYPSQMQLYFVFLSFTASHTWTP